MNIREKIIREYVQEFPEHKKIIRKTTPTFFIVDKMCEPTDKEYEEEFRVAIQMNIAHACNPKKPPYNPEIFKKGRKNE